MLGPTNSSSDHPIATMFAYDIYAVKECAKFVDDKKINYDKMWNFHHIGNMNESRLMKWDIKATKSEENRPTVERQTINE